jgi:hypothetical protein
VVPVVGQGPEGAADGRAEASAAVLTGVMRAAAWRDSRRRTLRGIAQRPSIYAVLLGILPVTESLAEFAVGHGCVPRMFADRATGAGGLSFALVVGLF